MRIKTGEIDFLDEIPGICTIEDYARRGAKSLAKIELSPEFLSDQAEQVNTKRNNANNLTAYGQKMINDSNIIKMIPKNKDIRAV